MKKVFTTTVLHDGKKYNEGKVYDLEKETADALNKYTKEPTKGAENEDGDTSANDKPNGK